MRPSKANTGTINNSRNTKNKSNATSDLSANIRRNDLQSKQLSTTFSKSDAIIRAINRPQEQATQMPLMSQPSFKSQSKLQRSNVQAKRRWKYSSKPNCHTCSHNAVWEIQLNPNKGKSTSNATQWQLDINTSRKTQKTIPAQSTG